MPYKDPIRRKEFDKQYWAKNKEKRSLQQKEWRKNNHLRAKELHDGWIKIHPERTKVYGQKYYLKNRDKVLARHAKRRKDNLELVRAIARKSANKNKAHRLAYCYRIRKTNVRVRIANSLRARVRNAIKLQKGSKGGHFEELLGISIPELLIHFEKQFKEGMSWDNYGVWNIDHIKPLSVYNLCDVDEQRKACHFTNLQPLWAIDNFSKGAKII